MVKYSLLFLSLFFVTPSFAYRGEERYGIMNTKGEIVTPAIFSDAKYGGDPERFLVVTDGDKQGVLGPDGKQVGKIEFDKVSKYACPLYEVYKDNKVGYMNQQGDMVIPCMYSYLEGNEFNNWYEAGLDNKYGMIDENNNVIFPFEYDGFDFFYYGETDYTLNIAVSKDGMYALANRKAEILTPFKYDKLKLFTRGGGLAEKDGQVCFLSSAGEEIAWGKTYISYNQPRIKDLEGMVGIISEEGLLQLYTYDGKKTDKEYKSKMPLEFSEGLNNIAFEDTRIFIDTLGNTVFRKPYHPVNMYGIYFRNGLAIVRHKSGLVGVINTKGEVVIPFQYDGMEHSSHFELSHQTIPPLFIGKGKNLKYTVITMDGESINDEWYDKVDVGEDGIAVIAEPYGMKFISFEGTDILPYEYHYIRPLRNGLLLLGNKEKGWGFYNIYTGNRLDYQFDNWNYSHEGDLWRVEKDDKYGVITSDCRIALPCEYPWVQVTTDGHILTINEEGVSAIHDQHGKVVRTFKKEKLSYLWDDLILFRVSSR